MAQGKPPRNPLAFASVLYPGRGLASQAAAVKPLGAEAIGSKLRPFSSVILFGPVFSPVPLLGLSHLGIAVWLRQGLSATVISFIPVHLLRCPTITPAAATPDLLLPSRSTAAATATSHCPGP